MKSVEYSAQFREGRIEAQLMTIISFNDNDICRGTKTSINIDHIEEKKIQEHFNFVTTKLEKLHKNLMWNMFIGRSYLDKVSADIKRLFYPRETKSDIGTKYPSLNPIYIFYLHDIPQKYS